ncbi:MULTISPECIES: tripartite tricarboxylate transporter substrate binding protein [unclassified Pigmentiphaga]|uniref:Bug family tripartite tricarboxylate transporter substrate binding protein n=1 Tax=unclassified Pigmentiphaga TaxID=2626614 RepID=UPI001051FBAA|nr:tripartite tricarboxylate transporter substrate binding protein [Pigmentiphaga sp. D-2]
MYRRPFLAGALASLALCAAPTAGAQSYPAKPLRFVVPFAAGGPADVVAREVATRLGQQLGQTIVVENMGGGHGVPAMNAVGRAAPDGYTLLMAASGNVTIQPLTMRSSAEAMKRLVPVGMVSSSPHVLVATTKIPVTSVQELIDYARQHPGKVNFGSAGTGGVAHLGMELFKALSRTQIEHIPYKGTSQVMVDLASGEVQALFSSMPSLKALIDKGSIRALGLTAPSKASDTASLPLISATLPGMEYTTWYGLYAPTGTPRPVIDKLNAELRKTLTDPALVARMREQSVDLIASTPAELDARTKQDTEKWGRLIKEENLKID